VSDVQGAIDYIEWMRTIEEPNTTYYDDLGRLLAYLGDEPTPDSWRAGVKPPERPGYRR
jgi:hypothetical protein